MKKGIMLTTIFMGLVALMTMCDKPAEVEVDKVSFSIDCDTVFVYHTKVADLNIRLYNPKSMRSMKVGLRQGGVTTVLRELSAADFDQSNNFHLVCPVEVDTKTAVMTFEASNTRGVVSSRQIVVHNAPAQLSIGYPRYVSRVTGRQLATELFFSPNSTDERYSLSGTDLGIMWDMEDGRVGMVFGDSYGGSIVPGTGGGPNATFVDWRSNVLAFTSTTDFENGLTIDSMAADFTGRRAREIMYSAKSGDGNDYTTIPSGAIHANGKDYIHYWNLKTWAGWTINHAGFYSSSDHGATWQRCSEVVFDADSRFGMVSMAKRDGYVYMIGSHSGRDSWPYLARFREQDILVQSAYQYWDNKGCRWVTGQESAATPLFEQPLGESSLFFHPKLKVWILFSTGSDGLKYRFADQITGPWTEGKILFDQWGCYAAMIHPFNNQDDRIWFNVSMWGPYNVFFMCSKIEMKYQ